MYEQSICQVRRVSIQLLHFFSTLIQLNMIQRIPTLGLIICGFMLLTLISPTMSSAADNPNPSQTCRGPNPGPGYCSCWTYINNGKLGEIVIRWCYSGPGSTVCDSNGDCSGGASTDADPRKSLVKPDQTNSRKSSSNQ